MFVQGIGVAQMKSKNQKESRKSKSANLNKSRVRCAHVTATPAATEAAERVADTQRDGESKRERPSDD